MIPHSLCTQVLLARFGSSPPRYCTVQAPAVNVRMMSANVTYARVVDRLTTDRNRPRLAANAACRRMVAGSSSHDSPDTRPIKQATISVHMRPTKYSRSRDQAPNHFATSSWRREYDVARRLSSVDCSRSLLTLP